jgi:hypothetical protein
MEVCAALLDWARPDIWRPWISGETVAGRPKDAARRLTERFHALRSFHAARPTDTASYYCCGIRPLSRARWHELVEDCFLSRTKDPNMAAAISRACEVQFEMVSGGRVHFCCDERLLEARDGYSLIYGSLSLLAVAIRIDREFGTDFKSALRQRGEPIVFVCEIPMGLLEHDVLDRLFAALCKAHTYAGEKGAPASPFGFHFSIPSALPPESIVGHHRPHYVFDAVYGKHLGFLDASPRPPHFGQRHRTGGRA